MKEIWFYFLDFFDDLINLVIKFFLDIEDKNVLILEFYDYFYDDE